MGQKSPPTKLIIGNTMIFIITYCHINVTILFERFCRNSELRVGNPSSGCARVHLVRTANDQCYSASILTTADYLLLRTTVAFLSLARFYTSSIGCQSNNWRISSRSYDDMPRGKTAEHLVWRTTRQANVWKNERTQNVFICEII